MEPPSDITPLLEKAHAGDARALNEVARRVQSDLLRLARAFLGKGSGLRSVTLDPAALVNETFVRLLQQRKRWVNRAHFFAIATRAMLRVIADHRRARGRGTRAGIQLQLSLGALGRRGVKEPPTVEAGLVAREMDLLEEAEPRAGKVAKLRVLWGLELDEIAEVLGVSRSTVDRDWRFARRWLMARQLMTQGQYGIGLLGFWSLGATLEMRTVVSGQKPHRLVLHRNKPEFKIEPLRGRLPLAERWTEIVVLGLHPEAMQALVARRAADYLASELRGQLLARDVELLVEDRMSRGLAKKLVAVRPPRFLGVRIGGLSAGRGEGARSRARAEPEAQGAGRQGPGP